MNGYAIAAVLAGAGVLIHGFVGSAKVVAPLLKARDLTPPSRWLMFLCWHAVTVLLIALTLAFGWLAWGGGAVDLGLALSVLAGVLALLTLYVATRARFNPLKVPPFVLFSLMAAAGVWAALA